MLTGFILFLARFKRGFRQIPGDSGSHFGSILASFFDDFRIIFGLGPVFCSSGVRILTDVWLYHWVDVWVDYFYPVAARRFLRRMFLKVFAQMIVDVLIEFVFGRLFEAW